MSWLLLLWIALSNNAFGLSLPAIGWIHLVALGWFTMTALSVLLFAIPQMADQPWRFETAARAALGWFAFGVVLFVLALFAATRLIGAAAGLTYAALIVYLLTAWTTLVGRRAAERAERAIARAFFVTLSLLAVVATLGLVLALSLSGIGFGSWSARLAAAHGNLALFGWLSLLVYGVSTRTIRPITGVKPSTLAHVVVGSATLLGAVVLAGALVAGNAAATWTGGALLGLGAIVYGADMTRSLARATVRHRPPQAFVAASIAWLFVALLAGTSALAGHATANAYGFVMLAGWIGQMVNAHMFHIGVRVIATVYRGQDDETPPEALLDERFEWAAFGCFQAAVALVAIGLWKTSAPLVVSGACFGVAGWGGLIAALGLARSRAMDTP
ncbi:MAG TPA: hypothetical protein VIX83_12375 [Candidatus Cybelea sp.]